MIIRQGTVIDTYERKYVGSALVKMHESGECKNCLLSKTCVPDKNFEEARNIEVIDNVGAKKGDLVYIQTQTKHFVKMVVVMYFLPIASIFIGIFAGFFFDLFINFKSKDMLFIFSSMFFLIISFILVYLFGCKMDSKVKCKPKIIKIIK